MKYVINFICTVLISLPATVVGYLYAAIVSGFRTGLFIYDRHEDASIKKWVKHDEKA